MSVRHLILCALASQGFAFVEFAEQSGLEAAIAMSGAELRGQALSIAESKPPKREGGRRGRGAGGRDAGRGRGGRLGPARGGGRDGGARGGGRVGGGRGGGHDGGGRGGGRDGGGRGGGREAPAGALGLGGGAGAHKTLHHFSATSRLLPLRLQLPFAASLTAAMATAALHPAATMC